jgi:hypothetical protein
MIPLMLWITVNHFENEFQFQLQGYAVRANSVNPLRHKRV